MSGKTQRGFGVDYVVRPNRMVTVVGGEFGSVNAHDVQALLDYSAPETKAIAYEYRQQGRYVPLVSDEKKIKSIVIMNGGMAYPSTFRLQTLAARIEEATSVDIR